MSLAKSEAVGLYDGAQSIDRAEMVTMTENFANGPSAAYFLKLLSFCLCLVDDISLKKCTPDEKFEYLKNPNSLKVSSKQVIDAADDFFDIIYNCMAEVTVAFSDVPEKMGYILKAFKTKDKDSMKIVSWAISCIEHAIASSASAVKKAHVAAEQTYKLVQEFSDKVKEAQGWKNEDCKTAAEKISNTIKIQNAKNEAADKAKEREEKEYKEAEKMSNEFLTQLKKDDGFWRNFGVTLLDAANKLSNGPSRRDTMHNNLQHKNRLAQESWQRAEQFRRERAVADQEALNIVIALSNLKVEEINLNDILYYLPEIIDNIAAVQNALKGFKRFFDCINRKVNSTYIKNMGFFIGLAKKEDGNSGVTFQDTLSQEVVKICANGIALLEIANIFQVISTDYIIPQIEEARLNFGKTKEHCLNTKKTVCDTELFTKFKSDVKNVISEHNNRIPEDVSHRYFLQ